MTTSQSVASSPQTWVLLNDVNKNSPKSYITKTVIITDIPQDNTTPILPTLDETYYFEYKSPVEAYNIVATDLNFYLISKLTNSQFRRRVAIMSNL